MAEIDDLKERCARLMDIVFERKRTLDRALMERDLERFLAAKSAITAGSGYALANKGAVSIAADGLELFLNIDDSRGALPFVWKWRIVHDAFPDLSQSFVDSGRFINVPYVKEGDPPELINGVRGVVAKYESFIAWVDEVDVLRHDAFVYRFEEDRRSGEERSLDWVFAFVESTRVF